jgi:hypothetical protein
MSMKKASVTFAPRTPSAAGRVAIFIFVKREGSGYPGNVGHHPGTTLQEVLRACIDRVRYLDAQISDPTNAMALNSLREAIYFLERRAARRHNRENEFLRYIGNKIELEELPTCPKCLHIGCAGGCHP